MFCQIFFIALNLLVGRDRILWEVISKVFTVPLVFGKCAMGGGYCQVWDFESGRFYLKPHKKLSSSASFF
jgi:hypothetical protein